MPDKNTRNKSASISFQDEKKTLTQTCIKKRQLKHLINCNVKCIYGGLKKSKEQ